MEREQEMMELLQRIEHNQQQSLKMQKEQFEMARVQFDRAEKLHDRAEKIQETSANLMGNARRVLMFVLPVIIILILYLTWLIFR